MNGPTLPELDQAELAGYSDHELTLWLRRLAEEFSRRDRDTAIYLHRALQAFLSR
jgi:hypothetical protein